jgi:hypothetical protein
VSLGSISLIGGDIFVTNHVHDRLQRAKNATEHFGCVTEEKKDKILKRNKNN